MLILPAIDLLDGRPVRLTRGDFDALTDYARDAAGTAVELERKGACWLHIVDLDAARGSGDNRAPIAAIRAAVGLRLQVGGGVRTLDDARRLLDLGVDRVVVGSALARDPRLPERWAAQVGDRLVAGIDADEGVVGAIIGKAWYEGRVDLADLLRRYPQTGPETAAEFETAGPGRPPEP